MRIDKNIYRFQYNRNNGYLVVISRTIDGRKMRIATKLFSDTKFGGNDLALIAARKYRDKIIKAYPSSRGFTYYGGNHQFDSIKNLINHFVKINILTGCWEWQGGFDRKGYGQFSFRGTNVRAARAAYEAFVGPIPIGFFVCHKCDNPSCCNPDHLFTGTPKDNTRDMINKGRHPTLGKKRNV